MSQCGINRGCVTIFIHVKINLFFTPIYVNKATDTVYNNRDFDYTTRFLTCSSMLPIPHAGVEARE